MHEELFTLGNIAVSAFPKELAHRVETGREIATQSLLDLSG